MQKSSRKKKASGGAHTGTAQNSTLVTQQALIAKTVEVYKALMREKWKVRAKCSQAIEEEYTVKSLRLDLWQSCQRLVDAGISPTLVLSSVLDAVLKQRT